MNKTRTRFFAVAVSATALLLASGCAGQGPGGAEPQQPVAPNQPNQPPAAPPPVEQSGVLTIVGTPTLSVAAGQQVGLRVQYTRGGAAQPNQVVTFRFAGDAGANMLSAYTAQTDAQGIATVQFIAAQTARGQVDVEALVPNVQSARWNVNVVAPQAPPAKIFAGKLGVDSNFALTGNFEGSSMASLLNTIKDISDDPQDPAKFIVDRIADKVKSENAVLSGALWVVKQVLIVEINKLLASKAGALTSKVTTLTQQITAMVRNFKTHSTLSSPAPQQANAAMTLDHTLDSVTWTYAGTSKTFVLDQMGITPPRASVEVTPTNASSVAISKHAFDLPLGSLVKLGLNGLLIPKVAPGATDIKSLLAQHIDCSAIGALVQQKVGGLGSPSLWASYCTLALSTTQTAIHNKLDDLDQAGVKLELSGQGTFTDANNDNQYDSLDNGTWSGSFTVNNATAVISGPTNTFTTSALNR